MKKVCVKGNNLVSKPYQKAVGRNECVRKKALGNENIAACGDDEKKYNNADDAEDEVHSCSLELLS